MSSVAHRCWSWAPGRVAILIVPILGANGGGLKPCLDRKRTPASFTWAPGHWWQTIPRTGLIASKDHTFRIMCVSFQMYILCIYIWYVWRPAESHRRGCRVGARLQPVACSPPWPGDVGGFPQGASKDGVQDLVGLVWQWTSAAWPKLSTSLSGISPSSLPSLNCNHALTLALVLTAEWYGLIWYDVDWQWAMDNHFLGHALLVSEDTFRDEHTRSSILRGTLTEVDSSGVCLFCLHCDFTLPIFLDFLGPKWAFGILWGSSHIFSAPGHRKIAVLRLRRFSLPAEQPPGRRGKSSLPAVVFPRPCGSRFLGCTVFA